MKRLLIVVLIAMPALGWAQRLLDFPDDFGFPANAVESLAERAYRARLQTYASDGRLDVDAPLVERLSRRIATLKVAADFESPASSSIAWEIHTCRRCGENASAMAGGRLLVGEEFIAELSPSDDELGYLLAHEMAHVLAQHTRELASVARYFVDNGRNRDYEDIQRELDESFRMTLRLDMLHVQQELEADYIGLVLGAESGHDPEAMRSLLRKLCAVPSSVLSTHPGDPERMKRIEVALPSAHRIRASAVLAR